MLKKWNNNLLVKPISDDIIMLYWFWRQYKRYNSDRSKSQFDLIYESNKVKIYMNGRYNGQTKAEYHKNFKRVSDIVDKSSGECIQPRSSRFPQRIELLMSGRQ